MQVELRRRLWAQICHLDYRVAESQGFVPSIHDSDFDTRLPLNIDDLDLTEGASSPSKMSDAHKFTDMTVYLIRMTGIHYLRRIVQTIHNFKRRLGPSWKRQMTETKTLTENQEPLKTAQAMAAELGQDLERLLRYCDKRIPMHAMALRFSEKLKCDFWVIFWIQVPREYREKIVNIEVRTR